MACVNSLLSYQVSKRNNKIIAYSQATIIYNGTIHSGGYNIKNSI